MRKMTNTNSDSSNMYSTCNDVEHLCDLSESAASYTTTEASYTKSAPEKCTTPSTPTPTPSTTTINITTTTETNTDTTTTTANNYDNNNSNNNNNINNNNNNNISTSTRVRKFTCHSIGSSSCSNSCSSMCSCNKSNSCCNNQVQPLCAEVSFNGKSNTYSNKCSCNSNDSNNIIDRQPQDHITLGGAVKRPNSRTSVESKKLHNHVEALKDMEPSLVVANSKASTMPPSTASAIVAAARRTQSYNHKTVQTAMIQKPPERRVTAFERISTDLETNPKLIRELSLGKRIGFYRIRGELGSGNFSSVKLGIHTLVKEKVAIKILDKTRLDLKTQRLLSREIEIMEHLRHPNIIRLYEVVETLAKVHLIMEYAPGGELFTKLSNEGRLTEPEAKFIFAQILSAVEHMHSHYIIHRDLKAENVFYAAPFFVKVGDFGFSTICRSEQQELNTFCGSPPYAAPELFRDDIYYGTFVDIWALGILLYFMVTGSMPFRAENVTRMKKCILNGMYAIPMFVSDSCHFLIRGILRSLPQDRFTIEEIKNSEWLAGENYPKALPPYRLCPTVNLTELKADEQETIKILCQLGITQEHLKEAIRKNTRNSIIGAYRIVLHRIQKKNQDKDIYAIAEFSSRLFKQQDNKKKMRSHISKLCSIL
ncbi:serine/threonine-protein kinase NIM1-like isoform X2 [Octopus sinensis]|nr:serine/threonine-protein kinase NIM1-like isoform X2 [Octopus sinensis]